MAEAAALSLRPGYRRTLGRDVEAVAGGGGGGPCGALGTRRSGALETGVVWGGGKGLPHPSGAGLPWSAPAAVTQLTPESLAVLGGDQRRAWH